MTSNDLPPSYEDAIKTPPIPYATYPQTPLSPHFMPHAPHPQAPHPPHFMPSAPYPHPPPTVYAPPPATALPVSARQLACNSPVVVQRQAPASSRSTCETCRYLLYGLFVFFWIIIAIFIISSAAGRF